MRPRWRPIFNECHRVLRDDGVLTVMFTHKSAGAWDGLGSALLQAGFTIETSWPVQHRVDRVVASGAAELGRVPPSS